MVIELVLDVVLGLLSALFDLLPSLPSLPSEITQVWSEIVGYLNMGMGFVGSWLYLPVALPCFSLILAVELWDDVYKMIRWFVNKIPFLGIKM